MAETPYFKFRLPPDVLADLNALAASNGGNNTLALKEAVTLMRVATEAAGRENAEELTAEQWTLLGHTGDPTDIDMGDEEGAPARDWSQVIALSLSQMHEGRAIMLDSHKMERHRAGKLAIKIQGWGPIRGYALMCALRYFWRHQEAGIAACASPEIWMTPTAKN
jgi:hypothetical protein